jgi:hypothetical protein
MQSLARIFYSVLAIFGIAGCQPSARDRPASIKELIESYGDSALRDSIHQVSRHLAGCYVLLPTEGKHAGGDLLALKVATDNQGREWAYAYTDESELLAAFPNGGPFVQLRFRDAFAMIAGDRRFGGIFINYTDRYKYLIPIEVFNVVQSELDSAPEIPPP